jgi:UDP-N-acetylglucosamine 2-epimerase (non-hydrolysing)
MKIASIVGARPNFIKCAPLSRELRKEFDEVIIHTGQHYDYEMNKVFFDELNIPEPDHHLGVGSGSHGEQTGEILKKIEDVLLKEAPDLLFCPTETAIENLEREGVTKSVHLTGDVMVDALKENIEIAERKSMIMDDLSLKPKEYYLATQKYIEQRIQMLLKS